MVSNIIIGIIAGIGSFLGVFVANEGTQTTFGAFPAINVSQGGTGQTSFTSSQLLYGSGVNSLQSVATTSASCTGSASCSTFSVIGSTPVSISATGAAPGGSGTNIQFRSDASSFGGIANSAWNTSGFLGIGSTTPWSLFAVASSTWATFNRPLFSVSTTSDNFGNLFSIFATSSTQGSVDGTNFDSGVRINIGGNGSYLGYGGLLDHLNLNGRLNTAEWLFFECLPFQNQSTISADTSFGCGDWAINEDGTATLSKSVGALGDSLIISLGTAVSADGMGFVLGNQSAGLLSADSSGVLEFIGELSGVSGEDTGLAAYVGFSDESPTSSSLETEPDEGCYFTASTTTSGWVALCKNFSDVAQFSTGISTTTPARLRVDYSRSGVDFFAESQGVSSFKKVFSVSPSNAAFPSYADLNPSVYLAANATSATTRDLTIFMIRLWVRYLPFILN